MKPIVILAAMLTCGAAPAQVPQQWAPVFEIILCDMPVKELKECPTLLRYSYPLANPPSGSWAACEKTRLHLRPVVVYELAKLGRASWYVDECRRFKPFTK